MFKSRLGEMSPQSYDYRSEVPSQASGAREGAFVVANAMGLKTYKPNETPNQKNNDLTNYLNWIPTKDKVTSLASLTSKKLPQTNKLSPLRAGGANSIMTEDDKRSQMSKTVLQVRDKFSYSQARKDALDTISVDGYSINAEKPKPRAFSNLKSINGYGQTPNRAIDVNSLYIKKNVTPSMFSPAPRRRILDELSWEDRQKLLGMSMNKLNLLKKEDILRAITLPEGL